MLELLVGARDHYDEQDKLFVTKGGRTITFEHSLVSLSKWESIFEKPFLGAGDKTNEEVLGYIQATVLTPDFSPEEFSKLSDQNLKDFDAYINSKQTATTFTNVQQQSISREVVTSELIYFWMINYQIPFECESWFLNRLLTLIQVCQVKAAEAEAKANSKKGFRGRRLAQVDPKTAMDRTALNAQRRAALNSKG